MLLQQNLFDLEPVILARLREQLAPLRPAIKVFTAADLEGVEAAQQFTPAVHLVYDEYSVTESRPDGTQARITQQWMAVVATRHQASLRTGAVARENGGAIAMAVCAALMGFKPTGASKPMRLTNPRRLEYLAGFHLLPLAFEAEMILQPKRDIPS
jgi:hypothetical protein